MNTLILICCAMLLHKEALRTNKYLNMYLYNVSIWIKHMVQKALKISGLMSIIISNLLVYFRTSKNNCIRNGFKNEIYQYYIYIFIYLFIYNLDLPHGEQAVGTSERPVGESSVEKKTNVCLL